MRIKKENTMNSIERIQQVLEKGQSRSNKRAAVIFISGTLFGVLVSAISFMIHEYKEIKLEMATMTSSVRNVSHEDKACDLTIPPPMPF